MKLREFKQYYPEGSPKAGQKTLFIEKLLINQGINYLHDSYFRILKKLNAKELSNGRLSNEDLIDFWENLTVVNHKDNLCVILKKHKNVKIGDTIQPHVTILKNNTPVNILFCPEIHATHIHKFRVNKYYEPYIDGGFLEELELKKLASLMCMDNNDLRHEVDCNYEGQLIAWSVNDPILDIKTIQLGKEFK